MKNLKKVILSFSLLALFVLPQISAAQSTEALQQQINALLKQLQQLQAQVSQTGSGGGGGGASVPAISQPTATTQATLAPQNIPSFNRDLYFGARGNDVTDLQEFLTDQGYYAGPISGYYGLLTVQAVKKFQSANSLNSTGYFGPRSRAIASEIFRKLVSQICPSEEGCEGDVLPVEKLQIYTKSDLRGVVGVLMNVEFSQSGGPGVYSWHYEGNIPGLTQTPEASGIYGTPTQAGVYNIVMFVKRDGDGAYGKERFTIVISDKTQTGQPPVISGVKGPTTLKVSEEGTWAIGAYDPQNGNLSYRVIWGDEQYAVSAQEGAPQVSRPFIQTATFSHTYRNQGVYTPAFYVVSDRGQEAKTSISVNVGGGYTTQLYYGASPTGIVRGQSYNFYAKVSGGSPNSPIHFFLQRPDGSMKYNDFIGEKGESYTDSNGNWSSSAYQTVTIEGQNGTWTSWVSVGGVASNKVLHYVSGAISKQSSIQVLSPNGGDMLQFSTPYPIKWNASSDITSFSVYLYKNDASYKVLATNLPAFYKDSGYTWTPSSVLSSTDVGYGVYKIYMIGYKIGGGTVEDKSDTAFSIVSGGTQSPITVTAPNGGEQWQLKSEHTILWTPYSPDSAYSTPVNPASQVTAYLEKLVSGSYVIVGKVIPGGKASIHWDTDIDTYGKYPDPGTYYIRVVNNQTGAWDRSDNPFTLLAQDTIKADLKVNGGDAPVTLAAGSSFTISWSATNADSCTLYYPDSAGNWATYNVAGAGDKTLTVPLNASSMSNFYDGGYYINLYCKGLKIEGTASDNAKINLLGVTQPPVIQATDSDNSPNYLNGISSPIAKDRYPDLFVAGVGKGIYSGKGIGAPFYIFGQPPDPLTPQISSNSYDTFYDHCANTSQLNEAFIQGDGKLGAFGTTAPQGYVCANGAFVLATSPIQPAITVLSPNGGNYKIGDTVPIQWTSTNTSSFKFHVDLVQILSNGNQNQTQILSDAPANSTQNMIVPSTMTPGQYKISVVGCGGSGYCLNNDPSVVGQSALFSIVAATQTLSAASAEIIGSQSTYTAGQKINFSVKGVASDGSVGIPTKGFNVQAWMQKTNPIETVQINGVYQSFNASYDSSSGLWNATMTAPSDTSQTYKIEAAFYCSNSSLGCSNGQINKSFTFSIVAGTSLTVSNFDISPSIPVAGQQAVININVKNTGASPVIVNRELAFPGATLTPDINSCGVGVPLAVGAVCGFTYKGSFPGAGNYSLSLYLNDNIFNHTKVDGTLNVTVVNPPSASTTVKVNYPNGGESLMIGQTYNITWSTTGGRINIELWKANSFVQHIAIGVTGSSGSYAWTIPSTLTVGSDYKITVSVPSADGTYMQFSDSGDAAFSIVGSGTLVPASTQSASSLDSMKSVLDNIQQIIDTLKQQAR